VTSGLTGRGDVRQRSRSSSESGPIPIGLAAASGMTGSPSFVREPEGNGVAERFIRTLKENLLRVWTFATAAELVDALREFRRRYNGQWLIARHGSRTPDQARADFTTGSRVLGTGPPGRRVG
jgi:transposase InsO family protein